MVNATPSGWPGPACDAAERLMRSAVEYLREHLVQLKWDWKTEKGVDIEWDSPEARAWIVRRLEERLFGKDKRA